MIQQVNLTEHLKLQLAYVELQGQALDLQATVLRSQHKELTASLADATAKEELEKHMAEAVKAV